MTTAQDKPNKWSDLAVRAASGVVMAVAGFALIWIGGWPFKIMCLVLGGVIFWEWRQITGKNNRQWAWFLPGIVYAVLPTWALIYLRTGDHSFTPIPATAAGLAVVIAVVATVIATDVGAYFSGRMIGGPKLAPRISPKKTWAGFAGGIVGAMLVIAILQYLLPALSSRFVVDPESGISVKDVVLNAILFSLPLSIVSQLGDLFESWLKRKFNVKDSSNLIPGHGGFMDRLDGLIFAASFLALFVYGVASL